MISVQTYMPRLLSRYVKCFWYLEVSVDLDQPYVEDILPDGHHEIIFHLHTPPVRKRADSDSWQRDPAVFFAGQNKKSYSQLLEPGAVLYGIRFYPHTQVLFYDFPAALSTDNPIPFSDIASNDVIASCITESPEETFCNLERELLKKASRLYNMNDAFLYVEAAIVKIMQEKGNVRLDLLEKITGVSGRHIEKSFQKFVGLSPKQFCNIIRYGHFIMYKQEHPEKSLTSCAYEADFHDQSHLIRLSHSITGESPKAYFGKQNYINDFFLKP